jgi:Holliday junction resolvase RusA-like endonuclease
MRLFIEYMPPNWNQYIDAERKNKYIANNIKQQEKQIVRLLSRGKRYTGEYPVEVIVRPHYNAYRQDLDNCRYKGLLDGLVSAGVLENDNLKHIQKITLEPIFDDKVGIEFEIKEIQR